MADIDEQPLGVAVLGGLRQQFQSYKTLADRALAQLQADDWRYVPVPAANSIAVIVQHLVGNLRSRFTDFLTSDGEKPDRQRDLEFIEPTAVTDISQLQTAWAAAWPILFQLLDSLQPSDLFASGHHSRRGPHGAGGIAAANHPLQLPRRPNRTAGQTHSRRRFSKPQHSARAERAVQPIHAQGTMSNPFFIRAFCCHLFPCP